MPPGSVLQLVSVLILLVIVIALAYFVSKWLAGYQKSKGASGNIEVLETYRIAANRFIAIIRVSDKYLAIAVGKDEVSVLTELDKDALVIRAPGETGGTGFSDVLKRMLPGQKDRGTD